MTSRGVCVMGAINLDLFTYVGALPRPGETVLARHAARALGGKAANQAVASARMGAATRLAGAVGCDADGSWLKRELQAQGVALEVEEVAGVPSGFAHVCVAEGGENAIVVVAGANAALDAARAGRAGAAAAGEIRLTQLESPLACVEAFLTPVPPAGGLRVLNAAPALTGAQRLFGLAEVLVVNEIELAAHLGRPVSPDPFAVAEAARALRTAPAQRVVATLGAAGLVAVDGDTVLRTAGRRVEAVDTTGAGDCFCGVLAACLAHGLLLAAALDRASAAAAISVTRQGAAPAMPTAAEVDALLSR